MERRRHVPFGDVHLAWRPEGLALFHLAQNYVDLKMLDYSGDYPLSETYQLHVEVTLAGRTKHFVVCLVPRPHPVYPDRFEIDPRLYTVAPDGTYTPVADTSLVQGLDKPLPHIAMRGGYVRRRAPIVKLIASALTIGSGGSAGKEGPIAQIGSGFGSILASMLKLKPSDRRILLLAGAAGGIGAIFQAPLGAALFVPGVLYRDTEYEFEAILPCIISSIMGSGMAANILAAGHTLAVYNRTASKAEALAAKGARVAASVAEVCARAEIVLTMPREGYPSARRRGNNREGLRAVPRLEERRNRDSTSQD